MLLLTSHVVLFSPFVKFLCDLYILMAAPGALMLSSYDLYLSFVLG